MNAGPQAFMLPFLPETLLSLHSFLFVETTSFNAQVKCYHLADMFPELLSQLAFLV